MTASLSDLIEQREALERQIRKAKSETRDAAIFEIRQLMREHGLTAADLAKGAKVDGARTGSKVAAKYRDPTSGQTWTGRGLKPKWLSAALGAGKSLGDFAI